MSHSRMSILEETGYVVLDSWGDPVDPSEWRDLTYVDWKSSGDTRFAPLKSAYGDIECNGFWHHNPPKADKDGVDVPHNVSRAPSLMKRVAEVGARVGRCRIIELQPNTYGDALYNSHLDDNNRLNPDGEGWVVRCFMQLTDDRDSVMVLRYDINDPSTETRLALPAGAQLVVDSERMWHSVWHPGSDPRYCLITSFESGPELEDWINRNNPRTKIDGVPIDAEYAATMEASAQARRSARTDYYGYDPSAVYSEA
ncbi:MAG: hypothetical protein NTZ03_11490 [Actinobacteria bacterium]|nr:hypothetical protein [Actinomycetota bacterium]